MFLNDKIKRYWEAHIPLHSELLPYHPAHCQKSETRWQSSMRNTVKMAVDSCKEMYEERKNFCKYSSYELMGLQCATRIMISALRATHLTENLRIHIRFTYFARKCLPSFYSRSISPCIPLKSWWSHCKLTRRFRAELVDEFNVRDSI